MPSAEKLFHNGHWPWWTANQSSWSQATDWVMMSPFRWLWKTRLGTYVR